MILSSTARARSHQALNKCSLYLQRKSYAPPPSPPPTPGAQTIPTRRPKNLTNARKGQQLLSEGGSKGSVRIDN